MYAKLAWRNIWRNPRRTIVILTAVVIGVWSMIFLGGLMRGMEVEMIQNNLATLTGNIQIHNKNYRSDPNVENSMTDPVLLENAIKRCAPAGSSRAMRVRVNAIVSNARHSTGVTFVGIEPEKEARVSFIGKAVTSGRYLKPGDTNKIVIGKALLDKFETKIGHKLVIMTQDTDGEIASRAFRIIGIFRAEMAATEKAFVFVPLSEAQKMLKLKNGISEVAIAFKGQTVNGEKEKAVAEKLASRLPDAFYKVATWPELLPMMREYLGLFNHFIYIWYFVVFIAMGFGIVNTTLMVIFERMREFGLLKALGMKPFAIIRGVITESVLLLALGLFAGNIAGFISVWLVDRIGIDLSALAAGAEMWGMPRVLYPELWAIDVIAADLVVLVLGILVSLYPAAKAARFTPVEALTKY